MGRAVDPLRIWECLGKVRFGEEWNLVIEIFRQLRNAAQFPSGNPDYLRLFGVNCPPIASVVMPTRKITAFVIDSNVVLLCAGVAALITSTIVMPSRWFAVVRLLRRGF